MKPSRFALIISIGINIVGVLCIVGLVNREAGHRWVQKLKDRIDKACGL